MIKNIFKAGAFLLGMIAFTMVSCSDKNDDPKSTTDTTTVDTTAYAKGADVSWLTEMEYNGKMFYNASGKQMDCIELLKSLGINSIRLRVWVNPTTGWCNKSDVLVKAWRAYKLGMRILIDFHYSDSWADPSQQTVPAAWSNYSLTELEQAVSDHTTDVLTALKAKGITPEWVQVGNETSNGMLWPTGKASTSMANYAALNNAGYSAVKTIFPNAKVVIHLPNGDNNSLYRWMFDGLKSNGGKWDVIGMSLYPSADTTMTWSTKVDNCIANMKDMISRYKTPVMLCEVGMPWDDAATAKSFLSDLITKSKAISSNNCLGIFYWEPEAYGSWNAYTLGAFDDSGKPTEALDAFK